MGCNDAKKEEVGSKRHLDGKRGHHIITNRKGSIYSRKIEDGTSTKPIKAVTTDKGLQTIKGKWHDGKMWKKGKDQQ